jgi:hypothetical protein
MNIFETTIPTSPLQGVEAREQTPMNPDLEDPGDGDILTACALRFDGYAYHTQSGFDHLAAFDALEQGGVLARFELTQHLDFFFLLKRYLCKWGGDMLSRRSP